MMRWTLGLVVILGACGGDDSSMTKKDAAVDSPHADAPIDSKVFMDAPPGTATLTIKNYSDWCKISEGGGTESQVPMLQVNLVPGTYQVNASGAPGFEIQPGMWHHVDGSTGNTGVDGTQTGGSGGDSQAAVTMTTANKCIWVCCAFLNGTGCDGLIDQCP